MKSNYKKLGSYIREINIKNKDLEIQNLLGVSIAKEFIPSIANTVGTDFSNYKIVKKRQFAYGPVTSRNGNKISIALLAVDSCIISSSYTVFEVIDTDLLSPEYLMLWFRRPEFDRYARFKSEGSVREIFSWNEMCNVELPIPDIEIQRKIVNQYNQINNAIQIKEAINNNLEQQAQAIFKSWFIDFEPFGGEMPEDWIEVPMEDLCEVVTKGTTPTTLGMDFVKKGINFIKAESISERHTIDATKFAYIDNETNKLLRRSAIKENDILFTIAGTLGKFAITHKKIIPANTNQAVAIIRADLEKVYPEYLYSFLLGNWHNEYYRQRVQQAVQANLSLTTIKSLPITMLPSNDMKKYLSIIIPILKQLKNSELKINILTQLRDTLLPKLMSGESSAKLSFSK